MKKVTTHSQHEKGAVLLETAIALPFLLYIAFMGFELTRLAELQLAKRDIIRVLSLSHVCGFRQSTTPGGAAPINGDAAQQCFQEAVNKVMTFTRARFPQMQVYIQTYVIDNPLTPAFDASTRLQSCPNEGGKDLVVTRVARSPRPSNFTSRVGFPEHVQVGPLGTAIGSNFMDTRMQLCRNGQITIAEFNVNRAPLFGWLGVLLQSSSNTASELHYEFGAI